MHCAPTARYQDLAPTEPERIIENCIHKQEGSCYPEGIIESNTIKQEESCYIDFLWYNCDHSNLLLESTPKSPINWILSGVEGCKHLSIRTLRLRSVSGSPLNYLFGVDSYLKFKTQNAKPGVQQRKETQNHCEKSE
jgi:hypothetical protein